MNLNEEEKVAIPLYSTYFIFKFLDATWKKLSHKICHLYILTVKLKNWFCLGIIFFFQIQINWLFLKKVTNILPLCAICWLFNNTVRFKIFCRQGETFLPRSVKSLSTLSFFVSLSPSLPLSLSLRFFCEWEFLGTVRVTAALDYGERGRRRGERFNPDLWGESRIVFFGRIISPLSVSLSLVSSKTEKLKLLSFKSMNHQVRVSPKLKSLDLLLQSCALDHPKVTLSAA